MKKIRMLSVVLIVLVLLSLSACAPDQTPETDPTDDPSEEVLGSYLNDAVYTVPLSLNTYTQVYKLGVNILLLGEDGSMTLLSGFTYQTLAAGQIPGGLQDSCLSVADNVWYYSKGTNEVVCLNQQLLETRRLKLPEGIRGEPALYAGGQEVFYCIGTEIRAMNIHTGVARLVKSYASQDVGLTGVYFDGSVLSCQVSVEDEISLDGQNSSTYYLSAEDGSPLGEYEDIFYLRTYGELFFLSRMDGLTHQFIFGDRMIQQPLRLKIPELTQGEFTVVLAMGGVVNYRQGEFLRFYDMSTGMLKAEESPEGLGGIQSIAGDPANNCLWFLTTDSQGQQMLCRWAVAKSLASGQGFPVEKLYTADDPDTEGLKICQDKADALYRKYGVRVEIWQNAVKTPGKYTLIPEYQTADIQSSLERVETVLRQLPETVVRNLTTDGYLRICIVRSISDGSKVVQYWQEGEPYIVLSVYSNVEEMLLRELFRVMDVYVIGNSRLYDDWNKLNPAGFVYGTPDETFITDEYRTFVNVASMTSPVEDRISLLYCAMQEGNSGLFEHPAMQAKLLHACNAIREAYDLEKDQNPLPWEQYLAHIL